VTFDGAIRVVSVCLGVLLLFAAVTVGVAGLPVPSAGATCGPGASSESAVSAFFDPGSIGAGPEPSVASGGRPQWQTFVSFCQSATDTRMAVSGGILAAALIVLFATPWVVRRMAVGTPGAAQAPVGWYADPSDPRTARWWDGSSWSPPVPRPPGP
jgi:hypothetical protein